MGGKGGKKKEADTSIVEANVEDATPDEGPVLTALGKRLRAARKKLRRVEELEQGAAAGKPLTPEQDGVVKSKAGLIAVIDELEKFHSLLKEAIKEEIGLVTEKLKREANEAIAAAVAAAEEAAAASAAEAAAAAAAAAIPALAEEPTLDAAVDTADTVDVVEAVEEAQKPRDADLAVSDAIARLLQLLYFSNLFGGPWHQMSIQERMACLSFNFSTPLQGEPLTDQDLFVLSSCGRRLTVRTDLLSHKESLQECLQIALKFLAKDDDAFKDVGVTTEWLCDRLERITASEYYTVVPNQRVQMPYGQMDPGMVPLAEGQAGPFPPLGPQEAGRPPVRPPPMPTGPSMTLPDDPAIFMSKRAGQPAMTPGVPGAPGAPGAPPAAMQPPAQPPVPLALQNLFNSMSNPASHPPGPGHVPHPSMAPPPFNGPSDIPPGSSYTFGIMEGQGGPPRGPPQPNPPPAAAAGVAQPPLQPAPTPPGPAVTVAVQQPGPDQTLEQPSAPPAPTSMLGRENSAAAPVPPTPVPAPPGPQAAPPTPNAFPQAVAPAPPASGAFSQAPGPAPPAPGAYSQAVGAPPQAAGTFPLPAAVPGANVLLVAPPSSTAQFGLEVPPPFVPIGIVQQPYGVPAPYFGAALMQDQRAPFVDGRGRGGRNAPRGPPPPRMAGGPPRGGRAGDFGGRRDAWGPPAEGIPPRDGYQGSGSFQAGPRDGYQGGGRDGYQAGGRDGYAGGGRRGGRGGARGGVNGHPSVTAHHLS